MRTDIHIHYGRDAGMMKFIFKGEDKDGKTIKFDIREPDGSSASRYAWERAEKVAAQKGLTNLRFADR